MVSQRSVTTQKRINFVFVGAVNQLQTLALFLCVEVALVPEQSLVHCQLVQSSESPQRYTYIRIEYTYFAIVSWDIIQKLYVYVCGWNVAVFFFRSLSLSHSISRWINTCVYQRVCALHNVYATI